MPSRYDKDPETGQPAFVSDPSRKQRQGGLLPHPVNLPDLSPEERQRLDEGRPPSKRVKIDDNYFCGARTPGAKWPTCRSQAGQGTKHVGIGQCSRHGGNTTAGNKSAARTLGRRIIAERKATLEAIDPSHPDIQDEGRFGGNRYFTNVTAEQALLEEVQRSVAMVRWLEERIGEWDLTPDPVSGEITLPDLVSETSRGAASMTDKAAWLLLYREERAHMVRCAKTAIDAGIAERLVRVAEEQGRMLASAVRTILDALHLTPDQARLVPQIVPQVLRSLSPGAPPLPSNGSSAPLPALLAPVPAPAPRDIPTRLRAKDR